MHCVHISFYRSEIILKFRFRPLAQDVLISSQRVVYFLSWRIEFSRRRVFISPAHVHRSFKASTSALFTQLIEDDRTLKLPGVQIWNGMIQPAATMKHDGGKVVGDGGLVVLRHLRARMGAVCAETTEHALYLERSMKRRKGALKAAPILRVFEGMLNGVLRLAPPVATIVRDGRVRSKVATTNVGAASVR
jgi:hypothetical protein